MYREDFGDLAHAVIISCLDTAVPSNLPDFSQASLHLFSALQNTVTLHSILSKIRRLSCFSAEAHRWPLPCLSCIISHHLLLFTEFQLHWPPSLLVVPQTRQTSFPLQGFSPGFFLCLQYSLPPMCAQLIPSLHPSLHAECHALTTLGKVAPLSLSIHLHLFTFLHSTFIT